MSLFKKDKVSEQIYKGFYMDNYYNRKVGRVGQEYGSTKDSHDKQMENTTAKKYKDSEGKYFTNRATIHNKIVADIVNQASSSEKPTCVFLLGGGASGKTYLYQNYVKNKLEGDFAYINSDDIKEKIPEYSTFVKNNPKSAANRVHEESSDIGKRVINKLIDKKSNFVSDTTLSNIDKALKVIETLKGQGYKIKIVGVTIPINTALKLAKERGEKSGRYVPEDVIIKAHKDSTKSFLLLKDIVDDYELWDNSGAHNQEAPQKIVSDKQVTDPKKFQDFIEKKDYQKNL